MLGNTETQNAVCIICDVGLIQTLQAVMWYTSHWLALFKTPWTTEASLTGFHLLMTWLSIPPVMESALFRFNQKFYKRSELDTIIAAIVRSVSRERSLALVKKIYSFSLEQGYWWIVLVKKLAEFTKWSMNVVVALLVKSCAMLCCSSFCCVNCLWVISSLKWTALILGCIWQKYFEL